MDDLLIGGTEEQNQDLLSLLLSGGPLQPNPPTTSNAKRPENCSELSAQPTGMELGGEVVAPLRARPTVLAPLTARPTSRYSSSGSCESFALSDADYNPVELHMSYSNLDHVEMDGQLSQCGRRKKARSRLSLGWEDSGRACQIPTCTRCSSHKLKVSSFSCIQCVG